MTPKTRLAIVFAAFLAGCAPAHPSPKGSSPVHPDTAAQNKALVRKLYLECINTGWLELLDDVISPDYVGPAGEKGPAGAAANIRALRTGFPDLTFTLEDLLADGDRVVVRWSSEGTHDGPFRGVPPTHVRARNTGIAIYQLADGKVVRNWVEADKLGVLQQLGAVSAPMTSR